MSVFIFTTEALGRIAESIKRWDDLRTVFRPEGFDAEYLKTTKESERDFVNHNIDCFVDRLYIANQLAFAYTYNEPISLKRLEKGGLSGLPHTPRHLQEELRSLRYNIATNGGNTFLGVADDKKLDALIELSMAAALREEIPA